MEGFQTFNLSLRRYIKETNLALMKLTDNQLEITTKRTIMENEQMSSDLATVSRSTEKLIGKNEELLQEHSAMRLSLELSHQMGVDLEKRNKAYQRTIKSLLNRLKDQEESRRGTEKLLTDKDMGLEDTVVGRGRLCSPRHKLPFVLSSV